MLLAAALSICAMMPTVVDDTVAKRDTGVPEYVVRQEIKNKTGMPEELKTRSLGVVNLVYALPKGSDSWSVKTQVQLTCGNEETIRGYQYPNQGARGRARSRSRHELDH